MSKGAQSNSHQIEDRRDNSDSQQGRTSEPVTQQMDLIELVRSRLDYLGCDGLVNTVAECGCHVRDLMPCCEPGTHCEAANNDPVQAKEQGADYWMVPADFEKPCPTSTQKPALVE